MFVFQGEFFSPKEKHKPLSHLGFEIQSCLIQKTNTYEEVLLSVGAPRAWKTQRRLGREQWRLGSRERLASRGGSRVCSLRCRLMEMFWGFSDTLPSPTESKGS